MTIIEEIKSFGFLNGTIKFGDYNYNIELLRNKDFNKYIDIIEKEDDSVKALQYICSKTLYRIKKRNKTLKKIFKIKDRKIYDFDLLEYPHVLSERFARDVFKVVVDADFFQKVIMEVVRKT